MYAEPVAPRRCRQPGAGPAIKWLCPLSPATSNQCLTDISSFSRSALLASKAAGARSGRPCCTYSFQWRCNLLNLCLPNPSRQRWRGVAVGQAGGHYWWILMGRAYYSVSIGAQSPSTAQRPRRAASAGAGWLCSLHGLPGRHYWWTCSACTTRREQLRPWLPLPGKPEL